MGKSKGSGTEAIQGISANETWGLRAPKTLDPNTAQRQGTAWSRENALNSRALQNEMDPYVDKTRQLQQQMVYDNLALGENLSPDTQRAIFGEALSQGGQAGLGFGSGATRGLTGATLGLRRLELGAARRAEAAGVVAANPEPEVGIDPGALVGLQVGNLDAQNAYNQQLAQARQSNDAYNRQLQQWKLGIDTQKKGGKWKGALGGAASGAVMGTAIMPGWGTAAGALIGGGLGYLGSR